MVSSGRPLLNVVSVQGMPIFQQLQMEEALLRAGAENWCLINSGTSPAIVMGMLGNVDEDVARKEIPILRRFSGGGTVVVDEDTVFFTLIVEGHDLQCAMTPVDVMAWTGQLLAPAFIPQMLCVEAQDYVVEGLKVGGNAQSFSRGRVVHHTSFLWSWKEERMDLLTIPKRQPHYRQGRGHGAFCNRLSKYFGSREAFVDALRGCLNASFDCRPGDWRKIGDAMQRPHRKMLQVVGCLVRP
jgi:lipoate-protein ligase A